MNSMAYVNLILRKENFFYSSSFFTELEIKGEAELF